MSRVLALTIGEPAGIGPDITLAAWQRRSQFNLPPFYVLADSQFLIRRAKTLMLDIPIAVIAPADAAETFASALPVVEIDRRITAEPAFPDASSAPAAIEAIRRAVADVLRGTATAVVTNPIAKSVLYRSGFSEPGHTEYLAKLAEEMA
ncbi:MAG: 4-hydroxythreonine-4-phosphate dehydrogenase, partial [Alphaproteobacteria bacterium]|nr:4-hydroxythreonine-4-phosphate dehydrogenase [Alphaproteobacteria bacterium]